jgi:peptide/nickel transport system permease protein
VATRSAKRIVGPRARSVGRQVGFAFLTVVVVSLITFGALNIHSARDTARQALGRSTTTVQLDAFVHRYGLDRPLAVRYERWLADFVRGNWGVSFVTQRPVMPEVVPRLARSLILALAALVVSVPLSLGLAVMSARRWGTRIDLGIVLVCVILSAFPEFVIGLFLLIIFAVQIHFLPSDSAGLSFGGFWSQAEAFVLPTVTLAIAVMPYVTRIARVAARDALAAPYTQAAVLRGLKPRTVVWDHAMRNAAVPIINAVAINFVYVLSGVIIVENVFGFPGVGQALVQAVSTSDVITVQAIGLVLGTIFVATSLLADVLVVYFNPRLRTSTA